MRAKLTFKTFLAEGGNATAQFKTERANKADIEKALELVSSALGLTDIKERLLGSTECTLLGHKADSGDVDLVLTYEDISAEDADQRMMELCNNEGTFNKGTKIGSYAVNVGNKKIQVDLMFVNNKDWAKFIYYSAEGRGSKYPGVVRNFLLMAVTRNKQEAGKDIIIKNGDKLIARATRAIKLDTGLERLFKMAKKNKSGEFNKGLDKIHPTELKAAASELAGREVKFDPNPDIIDNPDAVTAWLFGSSVKAADILSAEQVIDQIKKLKNADQIFKDAKASLTNAKLDIPAELP